MSLSVCTHVHTCAQAKARGHNNAPPPPPSLTCASRLRTVLGVKAQVAVEGTTRLASILGGWPEGAGQGGR